MAALDRFLEAAAGAGARFRQELPPTCVPIRCGRIVLPLDGLVADPSRG